MTRARIAIVDDDALFADYLATLLTTKGFDTEKFSNARDLLAALMRPQPAEIVLLDVLMPGMDGLETLRSIRASHPDLPVIMLSGQQVPATIVDALKLGALDYIIKSDQSDLGIAALETAIRHAAERLSLAREVDRLSAQAVSEPDGAQPCWSNGSAMRGVMTMIDRVADADVCVLIAGESGVGKEVVARELHRRSPRRLKPFIKVNCAALPSELLESELFGHERGAFTGAQYLRVGKFEFADGGSILLDEIGEMPAPLQAKLLHVLQDREFTRLGSNRPIVVDVRIIAATNRDMTEMIGSGKFREDLYYRLQVIEIHVPPLRARREEIPAFVEFFARRYAARYGRPFVRPSATLQAALLEHSWPGNVRELENVLKRFVILQDEALVLTDLQRSQAAEASPAVLPGDAPSSPSPARPKPHPATVNGPVKVHLPDLARTAAVNAEREAIEQALARFQWNRRRAARFLGVSYKTLLTKMRKCGISSAGEAST